MAGAGGRGGSGGSAYSWKERSGTDSNGNPTYRTRRNSGGFSGRSGHSGTTGQAGLPGRNGTEGNFYIEVVTSDTGSVERFRSPFDLEIVEYQLRDAYQDEIWEPGEMIYMAHLTVRNRGAMPMPAGRHAYLICRSNELLLSEPLALRLPAALEAGERYTFTEELAVRIRRPKPLEIGENPLRWTGLIDPGALMGGIQKVFAQAVRTQELGIMHPVESSPITGHQAIGRGDATRLEWRISNLSTLDQGSASDFKREIETRYNILSPNAPDDLSPEHILLFNQEGSQCATMESLIQEIPLLVAKGNEAEMENYLAQMAYVGIHPDAEPMTSLDSVLSLEFAHPDRPDSPECIQQPRFQVRVAKRYVKTPGSDILLVINRDTHVRTVRDIIAYYENLGSEVDIWDIAHYGQLDLEHQQENGRTLMEDFEGKTVVFLNNKYLSNQRKPVYSSEMLDKRQYLRAANDYGITFYLIGQTRPEGEDFRQQFNIPTAKPEIMAWYDRRKDVRRALKRRVEERIREDEGTLSAPLGKAAESVDNFSNRAIGWRAKGKLFLWMRWRFRARRLRKKAQQLVDLLERKYPQERFIAVFDGHVTEKNVKLGGLWGDVEWGTVVFRQGPHRIHGGRMVAIAAPEAALLDGSFFKTPDAAYQLALGLTIWESRELFARFLNEQGKTLENPAARNAFFRACMYHIATEQANLRMHTWTHLSRKKLEEQLVFFRLLTSFSLGFNGLDSPQAHFFGMVFSHTLALVRAQHYRLNWLFPRHRNLRLTRIIRRMIRDWIDRNFDTSGELRRKNPRLHATNTREKELFEQQVENTEDMLMRELRLDLSRWQNRGKRQLAKYIGEIQGGERLPNLVFSRKEFEVRQKADETRQDWLEAFEEGEMAQIEALTFQMFREGKAGEEQWSIREKRSTADSPGENAIEIPVGMESYGAISNTMATEDSATK